MVDNMCRLISDEKEIAPFLPQLEPPLRKAKDEISDPEARGVAERAWTTLEHVAAMGGVSTPEKLETGRGVLKDMIKGAVLSEGAGGEHDVEKWPIECDYVVEYVATLCQNLGLSREFDVSSWTQNITPYLAPSLMSQKRADGLVRPLLETCFEWCREAEEVDEEAEEVAAEDLCDCRFTLGYGALTLLNQARLHLKRGRCYGLVGPNDCGKTTLLRAINDGKVDGFPPKSAVRIALVEHGIGETETEAILTPVEYVCQDPIIQALQLPVEKIVDALKLMGFSEGGRLEQTLGTLSGGWKMKLGLARVWNGTSTGLHSASGVGWRSDGNPFKERKH